MSKKIYFWKIKAKETLSLHTQARTCICRFDACVRRQWPTYTTRVPKTYGRKFFLHLMLRFGMNPTSSESRSKPLFFNYIKPYMVYFKNTEKILRENLRFARNSESKREFFHKTSSSQFSFDWDLFWSWSFEFKITNHFFI